MGERLLLRKLSQRPLTCVSKLASLNTIPNSYLVLKLLGIWGGVRGVEGEERHEKKTKLKKKEKANMLGVFFLKVKGKNVSRGKFKCQSWL